MMGTKTARNAKVLIVDDRESTLLSLSGILLKKGYTVTCAQDGKAALEKVRSQPFDVVMVDIGLRDGNGVDVFFKIKEVQPSLSVILMTAYSYEKEVTAALQEGAYTILYKPFDIDHLITLIEEIMERRQPVLVSGPVAAERALFEHALNSERFKNFFFDSAEESLLQLRSRNFKLMVLMAGSKESSTQELIDYVRQLRPKIPVIVVGSASDSGAHPGPLDPTVYLPRPLKEDQFVKAVERWLPGR